ncbi:hypothetical protein QRO11_02820 [Paracidovorax citrulli]|uniref:Uncharacterized protein n=1 Tax=Paracidovorax citrulli TaxID=80869 RepID=A0ABY9ART6_PARCI|nr:hypothetical protein [Paracidovorax citrulli]UMT86086.1 hypothetical protein FRC75_23595 [Paracidovorax citrulli]UMT89925.1 hypothetical protein FRC90_18825 [Paracidovorax citrulli]WIY29959.1 hypothetical protein QRO09_23585 [Paracidovorax citrulli]WIY35286.1 hypothetical protein QRO11_02820 [Paracidovorax citrulli]WIY39179.1 hypothetical protein QRO10_23780 [Paracidovorax citrulli]
MSRLKQVNHAWVIVREEAHGVWLQQRSAKMIKKIAVFFILLFAVYFSYQLIFSSVQKTYCDPGKIRCIELKEGWRISSPMMSEKSIVLHKIARNSADQEVMTVDFFDKESPLLPTLDGSLKGERTFSWGTAAFIDGENKNLKALNYSSILRDKIYLKEQRAIIGCNNFNCLEDILKIYNNK